MMEGIDGNVSYGAAIAVKATLLLGLAFGLGFLFRRASASARHFLWAL